MQRLIQDTIKKELAEQILFGDLSKNGGIAYVDLKKGKINIKYEENIKKPVKVS